MITTADGLRLESARHGSGPAVVLAHGITADLDEQGLFVCLANRLAAAGFSVLRSQVTCRTGSPAASHNCAEGSEKIQKIGAQTDLSVPAP